MTVLLRLLLATLCITEMPCAHAKAFLESSASKSETELSDMLVFLLEHPNAGDVIDAVRKKHAADAHADNQDDLAPMFTSLPKDEEGNIALPAARYALHRLFQTRHRWFVRGLHPKSSSGNETMGKAMQTLTALDKNGLSLESLADLAGTLEELIQREVASKLEGIYGMLGYDVEDTISGKQLGQAVESYMTLYISGTPFENATKELIAADNEFMTTHTKDWWDTQVWMKSTVQDSEAMQKVCKGKGDPKNCAFRFNESLSVSKRVVEKYGFFNDRECHKLKLKLLRMDKNGTGRVRLPDFYKAGLKGAWAFNEKIDYLRDLGALDESDMADPKVMVPNYVSSWVNCLSPSQFYSVCCRNECEDYMEAIEENIADPLGDPDQIIRIVETQEIFDDKPRKLPALRQRLDSIAQRHHGRVPIHGRLFAQWMHHAFPRTCPYPHEAGKINPLTPDEWLSETGHSDIKASVDEVHKVVMNAEEVQQEKEETQQENAEEVQQEKEEVRQEKGSAAVTPDAKRPLDDESSDLPWSDVEELLIVRPTLPPKAGTSSIEKGVQFLEGVLVVALVCIMIWMASLHRRMRKEQRKYKY